MRQGDKSRISFCLFLKKTFRGKSKWSASCFQYKLVVLNLDIQKKTTSHFSIQTVDPERCSIFVF